MNKYLILLLLLISCEDIIKLELNPSESQMVIDAFINDLDTPQVIKLTKSIYYFDTEYPKINGAKIYVQNLTQNKTFEFIEKNKSGEYYWTPTIDNKLGQIYDSFKLVIEYNSEIFNSYCKMTKTTTPDSITFYDMGYKDCDVNNIYQICTDNKTFKAKTELWAKDIPIEINYYLVKSYFKYPLDTVFKFDNSRNSINVLMNANVNDETSLNYPSNGFEFNPQARKRIFDNPSYKTTIRIEIHSINYETFTLFLQIRRLNSSNPLFSPVQANLPTNIKNLNVNSKNNPVGWFAVSNVEYISGELDLLGTTIKKEK